MHIIILLVAAILLLGIPVESCAKNPAELTYHAADTTPETAEENAAHAKGRAVDMNEVNTMPVRLAVDPSAPEAKREAVRELLHNLEMWARGKSDVEVFISPIGGFHRDARTRTISREVAAGRRRGPVDDRP